MHTVVLSSSSSPVPYALLAAAGLTASNLDFTAAKDQIEIVDANGNATKFSNAVEAVTHLMGPCHEGFDWTGLVLHQLQLKSMSFAQLAEFATVIDASLSFSTFIDGHYDAPRTADVLCWSVLRNTPAFLKSVSAASKKKSPLGDNVLRWFKYMSSLAPISSAIDQFQAAAASNSSNAGGKKDQASYEIGLVDAVDGKVVTRFPPEPSGYLHIGHAKAAMLNEYFARKYHGKLILRFDDTNPSKEKAEYEQSIIEDLQLLDIRADQLTYTSDYFAQLEDICRSMLRDGLAYADDTSKDDMAVQRMDGIASPNRDTLIGEAGVTIFESMLNGEDSAQKYCIRARISVDNPNKAMRDPVIYRCNRDTPHHRTGRQYAAYPTYDFACPVVDSVEGVTHALRTNEYHDRNAQYAWFQQQLKLRTVHIWDYSRMNFVNTLMSKRKLLWLVEQHIVHGWDDPRMPTIRGIRRRGLSVAALKEYILMQGPSKNMLLLEWDKLWAINKKMLDPNAPRHVAIDQKQHVTVTLTNGPTEAYAQSMPKHKKNEDLGTKETSYSSTILLEQSDAQQLQVGMEVTLMDWGNIIVDEIVSDASSSVVVSIKARLHLEGDFKKTSLKLTWLSTAPQCLVSCTLLEYEHVLAKKKLEEEDKLEECINRNSEIVTVAFGDSSLGEEAVGSVVQLERKGLFVIDSSLPDLRLIAIPDGRLKK